MKLFSKKRSLAVCAASVALAAAVLLTGCGGSDGGGGGSTPTPNPNPVEPVEPEEPKEEMDETKTIAAPGEEIKTEEVTMKVDIADDVAGNVQTDKDNNITYTPFTFHIKNTSGKRIDLNEEPVQLRARSMIALCADTQEGTSLADKFNSGKQSQNLTVKMNGKDVPAKVEIQVYNAAGGKESGTVLEEMGWYAEFDVVAQVPDADWVERNEPLKVDYTLPEQKDGEGNVTAQAVSASFAVTSNGEAPKAVLTFEDQTIELGHSAYIEYDDFYMVNHIITITNDENSASAVDISGFMGKEETQAMAAAIQTRATELANAATTYSGILNASAQAYKEVYTSGKYDCKTITLSNNAPHIGVQNPNTANTAKKKYLNPGESVQVQVSVYVEKDTKCGFTATFDGNEMFTVKDEDYNNLTEKNSTKMTSDNYTKFPQIMGQIGASDIWQKEGETAGQLIQVNVAVANSTSNDFNTQNTLTTLGIMDREQLSDMTLAKVRSGKAAATITATVYTKNGKTYENLPVVVARRNGVDPILKQDEIDRLFAFTFVPCGESNEWTYIAFYMMVDGEPVNIRSIANPNQSTTPSEPSDGKDIGGGKTYKALGKYQTNMNEKTAVYDGVNMALMGYFKYASDDSYDYIGAVIRLKNASENVNVPLENGGLNLPMTNGKIDYAAIAASEDFASEYITIKNDDYAFGVLSTKSNNTGSNGVDTSTLYPNAQEDCTGNINVVIRVPKNWNSNLILKYTLPWTNGKYVQFELSAQDILGDVTSSDTSSEELKLQWYGPNFSNQGAYLCQQVSDTEYVVASNCMVKNQGTSSFVMNKAVLASDFEEVLTRIAQSVAKQNPNATEEELTKLTLQAYVKNMEDTTVMVKVGSTYYKAALLVDQKVVAPGDEAKVYVMALLPAGGGTLQYCYNGKPFTMLIQYPEGAYATATQSMASNFASLFRAVK